MADQTIIDYKECFGTVHGKGTLEHLKRLTRFNSVEIPHDLTGRIDPLAMARNEGMRSVIIHIKMMLKKDPDEVKGIDNERRD